jgi:hypothetical protein
VKDAEMVRAASRYMNLVVTGESGSKFREDRKHLGAASYNERYALGGAGA